MSLLFMDGFDHYGTGGATVVIRKWDEESTGWEREFVETAYGRNGRGVRLSANSGNGWISKNITPSSTVIFGIAHRRTAVENDASDPLVAFMEGSGNHIEVRSTTGGVLCVTRNGTVLATGTKQITANVWYYIELKATIHDTTGSYTLRIDGVNEVSATGVDTRNGGTGVVNRIYVGLAGLWDGGHASDYDDCYVLDGTGSVNNDFLGDVKVETIVPTGAGNYAEFTPSTGSNWQNVDELTPDDDTTYNGSDVVGERDSFALGNMVTTVGSIKGIQHVTRWRKDDAGSRSGKQFLRVGSTDYDESTATVLSTSYTGKARPVELNPATGAAWTIAEINALEAGYKVEA